jgi:glycosyltransferase 2 family protein
MAFQAEAEPGPITVRTERLKSSGRSLYWFLAIALAGVLLFFSLRGIRWPEVWNILIHANLGLIVITIVISTVALVLRAFRWRILLQSGVPVPISTAFWATAAGYFGNSFLPARAGELIRSLIISRATSLSKGFVLTTALSERICDAIALVFISSLVMLSLPVKPGWFAHAAIPFSILGLCGVFCIAVLPLLRQPIERALEAIPLSETIRERGRSIIEQVLIGMRSFHNRKRLFAFATLTISIWFCDTLSTVAAMRALALSGTLVIAILLVTGLALSSALPSTPGYVGVYQFVAVSVLTPFGFKKTSAIAYILLSQALQYVLITFWGGLGLLKSRRLCKPFEA